MKEDDEQVLSVRYKGTANQRILMQSDLSGLTTTSPQWGVVLTPGAELPFELWEQMAASPERARSVLSLHSHEFELVGPGADEYWTENDGEVEFDVSMGDPE